VEEATAQRRLRISGPRDLIALALATGLGLGFAPVAPGTFGSLLGVALSYLLLSLFRFEPMTLLNATLAAGVALALIGIWASARAETALGEEDAQPIVIDEICGQVLTYTFVGMHLGRIGRNWTWALVAGFLLFRLCDIFKPYPIRRLESLGSGLGAMADDVLAGLYAALALHALLLLHP
jgi:phosphatidylglycerophosphatase A